MQGSGSIGLIRADARIYIEQVHHYFGCPHSEDHQHEHNEDCHHSPTHGQHDLEGIVERFDCQGSLVYKYYNRLTSIVQNHEELIRKRWLKKTRSQRQSILLEAMPHMAPRHRPDFELFITNAPMNAKILYTIMLPHINLEDLTQTRPLLIMLNARGRYPPEEFAYSDLELAPYYKAKQGFLQQNKHTMAFLGQKALGLYGALTEWKTEAEAGEAILSGCSVHIDHGHQILEIQGTLYPFLVDCCTTILHDHDRRQLYGTDQLKSLFEENPDHPAYVAASTPDLPPLPENEGSYINLNTLIMEAPYRRPARLDLARLKALVVARKEQAQDHIWTLREDPNYFSDVVKDHMEHRLELIADCWRGPHKKIPVSQLYSKGLRTLVNDAYMEFFLWDELQTQFDRLHKMAQQYSEQLVPDKDLPAEYFEGLVETRFLLEAIMLDFVQQMKNGYMSSPQARPNFVKCYCSPNEYTGEPEFLTAKNRPDNKGEQEIDQLMDDFLYKSSREKVGLHILMERLGKKLEQCPKAKDSISPWVASYISQLSVISECLHQIHLFQPWAQKVGHTVEQRNMPLLVSYLKKLSVWHSIQQTNFEGTKLSELGNPSDGKFNYPVHRRQTRENFDIMRAAEAALDTFWETVDARYLQMAGKTPYQVVSHTLGPVRLPYRTPPWVEPVRKPLSKPLAQQSIHQPLLISQHDPTKQITGHFDRLSFAKDKSKAREKGTSELAIAELTPETIPITDEQPTFHLDRRAYKVFKTLFHQPSSTDTPSEIQWVDFLHAMVATAFSAEKLQGSAWHFQPKNLDIERGIQFHEPHPGHKIPFTWARHFGRRLARTYGWRGDMFRLK
ncbi:hypothetical protein P154DRAFT_434676 [Amniculicola lignicola CBS 123094]|uniref:Uncharacterized protein n=1 Tax=Amniculicola lignicola CBS 123094 TaxID=1392246 RepID=A0A6A5WGH2_9PLEO|nr:hypothetical protein P154DRAFT_434676 [Amniculicola lignicola CBS 123094]